MTLGNYGFLLSDKLYALTYLRSVVMALVTMTKGDTANPNYISRLAGREYNQGKYDTLYASTPPLEALRLIISHAPTLGPNNEGTRRGHGKQRSPCVLLR